MVSKITQPDVPTPKPSNWSVSSLMTRLKREALSFWNSIRSKPLRDQMKTKNFYFVILFLVAALSTLWILIDPSPSFHTIVSETHKQISNIKNIPSNIRQSDNTLLDVNPKYLARLGLPTESALQPVDIDDLRANSKFFAKKEDSVIQQATPVIVVPVTSKTFDQTKRFLTSVKKFMPGRRVRFYDLGLSGSHSSQLKKVCNVTKNHCEVKLFSFNKYPSHVRSIEIGSYVPLCIQESLSEFDAIIWSIPGEYFLKRDISGVITKARKSGIAAWTIKDTTSSITYPKTFSYFSAKPESYYFHRAIKTSHLIVFNTEHVRTKIMLPWVKCALVDECVSPMGSQQVFCSPKRPRYLYSGCHYYEQSALNVILGQVFQFDVSPYSTTEEVFGVEVSSKNLTVAATSVFENT